LFVYIALFLHDKCTKLGCEICVVRRQYVLEMDPDRLSNKSNKLLQYQQFMIAWNQDLLFTYWHLLFCEMFKTENQLTVIFPWHREQKLMHSN